MVKITIIGAGNVGSQAAFYAALKNLGNIVIIYVVEGLAEGKALDILQSMPIAGSNAKIIGGTDYRLTENSDIVIVTAGIPRKPGMSRDDLLNINANIIKSVVPQAVKHSPNCILIVLTNPLDTMVQLAYKISNIPKSKRMAGVLDTARFRTFISQELHVNVNDVEAMVLGGHGDQMVPIIGKCTVKGKQIAEMLTQERIEQIVKRIKSEPSKLNRNLLYELIKLTAPITIYKLAKMTDYSYNSIKDAVREFEFAGLVKYKVVLGENNVTNKLICLPDGMVSLDK